MGFIDTDPFVLNQDCEGVLRPFFDVHRNGSAFAAKLEGIGEQDGHHLAKPFPIAPRRRKLFGNMLLNGQLPVVEMGFGRVDAFSN